MNVCFRAVLQVVVITSALGACEAGRVVHSYPEAPPDLVGQILAVDLASGVLVLGGGEGGNRSVEVTSRTSVARRVANLVTADRLSSIKEGAHVEIWLVSTPGAEPAAEVRSEAVARQLIVVDFVESGFEPVQPPLTFPHPMP